MSFISWIIVGALAGWLGSLLSGKSSGGLLSTIIIGIIGSFIGGWIASALNLTKGSEFSLVGILFSALGAAVLLLVLGMMGRK